MAVLNLHIGRLIKTVFERSGMSVSEFARQLNCERTNIYTIFKRRTIDVELLINISKILASKVARMFAKDFNVIVNPHVVNAACFSGISDNMLYTEGWALTELFKGNFSS